MTKNTSKFKLLDSIDEIRNVDVSNILGSINELPNQCLHAWKEASRVKLPNSFKNIKNVVLAGMGGSGLGARVIESLYRESLSVPIVRVNDYHLPGFVNKDTLVICSSYSGNTEEMLSVFHESLHRKAKTIVMAAGGKLKKLSQINNLPIYVIKPKHNPSNQPRMAIGYSVVGQLVLASKANIIDIEEEELLVAIDSMQKVINSCSANIRLENNLAKQYAVKLYNNVVYFISSRHLTGAMHTVNNQLNENTKNLSADYEIPEINHHLMEGLKHPKENINNIYILLAESNLYGENIRKRFKVTKNVIRKNNINYLSYLLKSPTKLGQVFELIQFGAYVDLYLAMLYGQDPAPIPWVNYFKKELAKA